MIKVILRVIDSVNEWTGKIVGVGVFIVAGIIAYEVVCRYVFNSPTMWVHETSAYLWGGVFMLGGGYTLLHGGHVNMDLIYGRLAPRTRAIVYLVTSVLFFLFCGVMLWKGIGIALLSVRVREVTFGSANVPIYPVMVMIPIGCLLLLLQGVAQFIRALSVALGKSESL